MKLEVVKGGADIRYLLSILTLTFLNCYSVVCVTVNSLTYRSTDYLVICVSSVRSGIHVIDAFIIGTAHKLFKVNITITKLYKIKQ